MTRDTGRNSNVCDSSADYRLAVGSAGHLQLRGRRRGGHHRPLLRQRDRALRRHSPLNIFISFIDMPLFNLVLFFFPAKCCHVFNHIILLFLLKICNIIYNQESIK